MEEKTFIKHIAGEYAHGVQHCIFCGKLLADYRNTVSPDEFHPTGWPENNAVYVNGGFSTTSEPNGKVIQCSVFE